MAETLRITMTVPGVAASEATTGTSIGPQTGRPSGATTGSVKT